MRRPTSFFLMSALFCIAAAPVAAQEKSASGALSPGAYLAIAADCGACHTAPNGKPFAGGLPIDTPVGRIYATNITPSKKSGIGAYSLADFTRALRHGVRSDGANLYPAMPYPAFAGLTDADVQALYAYFMHDVAAVDDAPARKTDLPFPFNLRFAMKGWNLLFLRGEPFKPVSGRSDEWNRGAYLAQALAHCQTCHTPRNALMGEERGEALAGGSLGAWYAPNITPDKASGVGAWTKEDIVAYLRSGHNAKGSQAGGPMLEAIDKSLSKLRDSDLKAIAEWLMSVPAIRTAGVDKTALRLPPATTDINVISGKASAGATIYADNCASCHMPNGEGVRGLPALAGAAAFTRPVADNVVMAVLSGVTPTSGQDMPGFANRLNDAQIAELTNDLFQRFGDPAVRVTPERVAELRAGGAKSDLVMMVRVLMIAAAFVLFAALAAAARSRTRKAKAAA